MHSCCVFVSNCASIFVSLDGSGDSSSPTQTAGFSLGHGFQLKLKVHMAKLLPDNFELACRTAVPQRSASCSSEGPQMSKLTEDMKGLMAWSVCFVAYVAIISNEHHEKFQ